MIEMLPFPAILLDDYLEVAVACKPAYELFHIPHASGDQKEHARMLSRALKADTGLIASIAAATLRADCAGRSDRFNWSRDGRYFAVTVCAMCADGPFLNYALFFDEETEQILARKGGARIRSYLETIMNSLYLGIVVTDRDLRVTQINQAQADFSVRGESRYSQIDAVGMTLVDLFPDEEDVISELIPSVLETGATFAGIIKTIGEEPNVTSYSIGFSPIHDLEGSISGVLRICEDISDKQFIEDELRRAEVKAREMKVIQELLATLHHEINNSLTKIIGYSELLTMASRQMSQEEILAAIEDIKIAAERIEQVTKQLGSLREVKSTEYLNDGTRMIDIYSDQDGGTVP